VTRRMEHDASTRWMPLDLVNCAHGSIVSERTSRAHTTSAALLRDEEKGLSQRYDGLKPMGSFANI
jgi:hypothetical protein